MVGTSGPPPSIFGSCPEIAGGTSSAVDRPMVDLLGNEFAEAVVVDAIVCAG